MDDRLDVDAAVEEGAREPQAAHRVADDDRNHRGPGGDPGIEPPLAGEPEEEARQLPQAGDTLRLAIEDAQRSQRRRRVRRGDSNTVDKAGRRVLQVLDELGGAGDVPAAAGKRLGERAHPDVDGGGGDAGVLADAAPGPPHRAERMGLVDIEQRVVLFLDVDEAREVGVVAVHAVDAFDRDQHAAVAVADAREEHVERAPVVVGETAAGRAGEPRALEDRVVRQDVVDDEVARAHQVPDGRDVGRVPRDEDDRRRRAEEGRECALEVAMDLLFAGDEAARARTGAVAIDRILGCGDDLRILRHAHVVVGAEVGQRPAVHVRGTAGARRRRDRT